MILVQVQYSYCTCTIPVSPIDARVIVTMQGTSERGCCNTSSRTNRTFMAITSLLYSLLGLFTFSSSLYFLVNSLLLQYAVPTCKALVIVTAIISFLTFICGTSPTHTYAYIYVKTNANVHVNVYIGITGLSYTHSTRKSKTLMICFTFFTFLMLVAQLLMGVLLFETQQDAWLANRQDKEFKDGWLKIVKVLSRSTSF